MPNSTYTSIIYRESIFFFKYVESRLFNFNAVTAYIVIILHVMGELLLKKKNQHENFRFGYQYIIWKLAEVLRPFTHYVKYNF